MRSLHQRGRETKKFPSLSSSRLCLMGWGSSSLEILQVCSCAEPGSSQLGTPVARGCCRDFLELYRVCEKCLPRKKEFLEREDTDEKQDVPKKSKNYIPKNVRMLMKKKQELSQKIMKSKSWKKNYSGMLELQELKKNYQVSHSPLPLAS